MKVLFCKGMQTLDFVYYIHCLQSINCGFCILLSEHHKEQETLEQPDSRRQCADGEEMAWSFIQQLLKWKLITITLEVSPLGHLGLSMSIITF